MKIIVKVFFTLVILIASVQASEPWHQVKEKFEEHMRAVISEVQIPPQGIELAQEVDPEELLEKDISMSSVRKSEAKTEWHG